MTTITRSTPSTPICRPQLPPPTDTNAGALQPSAVRQEAIPRPCSPPTMNPPFTRFGITTMHFAPSSTSSGMPLSGVLIMACSTSVDICSRWIESCRPEAAHTFPLVSARAPTKYRCVILIDFSFDEEEGLRKTHFRWADLAQNHERGDTERLCSKMITTDS